MCNDFIPIITREESYKLPVDEICYIYRFNRKLMFETDSGLKHSYDKIDVIAGLLGPNFYRCMAGCIVNLARIEIIRDGSVKFDNGTIYNPGKAAYRKIKRMYNNYLVQTLLYGKFQDDTAMRSL